ncbi:hypothetical protein DF3PA_70161 [Candidatus Defluviicoccus seviourii]|uniref:Transmembrane protein n=2 Tax=root TaxID=1 RepID=A0A564WH87_9PROT|nr:conserved hypothetical protein [uncultured Defluviicoccus sp.]VUX47840.1 hypothetical protein DF3PA_70161 [Candidatus Defluviicoccus seviourii]
MDSPNGETQDGYISIDQTPTSEEEQFNTFSTDEERRHAKLSNDSDEQDMGERLRYADHAYGITQAWVGFLIVLTITQISLKPLKMGLETTEFVTVFTTTTASIFGFWLLVGNYLFHRRR